MSKKLINFVVGGIPYAIFKSDIKKYPKSFLAIAISNKKRNEPITIDRDGEIFRFINAFLVTGHLPTSIKEAKNQAQRNMIYKEAEFYNLEALQLECGSVDVLTPVNSYKTIRNFLKCYPTNEELEVDHPLNCFSALIQSLRSVWAPFFCRGDIAHSWNYNELLEKNLYKNSSLRDVKIAELLASATPSAFGRGMETVFDPRVRDSLEIPAAQLNQDTLRAIQHAICPSELCPTTPYELRPYKLVIYQQSGHFDQHRDTVRGKGHIGTVVLVLNSAYTGGELEITHGGRTEVVTGPYHWVAMYGDCLHKINPVTSGTRVSLIYDIYASTWRRMEVSYSAFLPFKLEEEEDEDMAGLPDKMRTAEIEKEERARYDYLYGFWDGASAEQHVHGVGPDAGAAICQALDQELNEYQSVVICLQHMYPACQAAPSMFKGGDQVLYDLLHQRKKVEGGKYEVQVVYCSIHSTQWVEYEHGGCVTAKLFTSFDPTVKARKKPSSIVKEGTTTASTMGDSRKETKLVIPTFMNEDNVLEHTPYAIHGTGNHSRAEEHAYVVAGLQVRRREG